MTTRFTWESVQIAGCLIWIDGNSKIAMRPGGFDDPEPNAFSLPSPETCVGATTACRAACYTRGLREAQPVLALAYQWNLAAIRSILADPGDRARDAAEDLGIWINTNCPGGFRWHVSGDVFSAQYAAWIVRVCRASPEVRHWIYTRAFDFVPTLAWQPNLTVNLSADAENLVEAQRLRELWGCRICYLWRGEQIPDLPDGSVVFPDYHLRLGELDGPCDPWPSDIREALCPADYFGQSPDHKCGPCRKCIDP